MATRLVKAQNNRLGAYRDFLRSTISPAEVRTINSTTVATAQRVKGGVNSKNSEATVSAAEAKNRTLRMKRNPPPILSLVVTCSRTDPHARQTVSVGVMMEWHSRQRFICFNRAQRKKRLCV